MKELMFTVISSIVITSSFANSLNLSMPKFEFQHKDGRVLDIQRDVEAIHLNADKVDYIELGSGEVVDQNDIWQASTSSNDNLVSYIKGFHGVSGGFSTGLQSLYLKDNKIDYVEFDNGVITDGSQIIDILNGHLIDGSFGIDGGG